MASYSVGLDIGINGVGWAVVDTRGRLIRHGRHHHLWGIAMFDQAECAKERRLYRLSRRRLSRRKYRLALLQELMYPEISEVDPDFFRRLKESSLVAEDRTVTNLYLALPPAVFEGDEEAVRNTASGNRSIPIYHIRHLLATEDRKADIRYVYLALAHILKHRGHFLSGDVLSEKDALDTLSGLLHALRAMDLPFKTDETSAGRALELLKKKELQARDLTFLLEEGRGGESSLEAFTELLLGREVALSRLFSDHRGTVSAASEDFEESIQGTEEPVQDALRLLRDLYLFRQSHTEESAGLSEQMDELYLRHRRDLRDLKSWMRTYASPLDYQNLFHHDGLKVNYNAYVGVHTSASEFDGMSWLRCSQEEFYHHLRDLILANPEGREDAGHILSRMFDERGHIRPNGFLPLQRIRLNSAISNARQLKDMEAILDRQGKYHACLREHREQILQLCTFRIPYYVGPLRQGEASPFTPWIRYKKGEEGEALPKGPVTPWNFREKVDIDATAESFSARVQAHCSFLPMEDVLPRHSLLYEEYMLLDEINRIRVNGRLLRLTWKRQIIEDLFLHTRHVTPGLLRKWLSEHTDLGENIRLTTTWGEVRKIKSSLGTRIDMERIFGRPIPPDDPICEDLETIIRWSTLFEDRAVFRRVLERHYAGTFSPEIISKLSLLRYRGWGRLSRRFLCGIRGQRGGEEVTIMDVLRNTSRNLMKIYHFRGYGFQDAVSRAVSAEAGAKWHKDIPYEDLDALPCPPDVRRGVWMGIRILKELEEVMGGEPRAIYLRNMREDNANRHLSARSGRARYDRIVQMYRDWETVTGKKVDPDLRRELSRMGRDMSDRAYLYFSQLGLCMYSGKPLSLTDTARCEAVYVIPPSLQMDTSLDNQVLVLREENHRSLHDPVPDEVIRRMAPMWQEMHRAGLLSAAKLSRLMVRVYDEQLLQVYVTSQLTETSRMAKVLRDMLHAHYTGTHVYGINARLTQSIRASEGLPVMRSLNDMTQVFDAFLTAHIGTFADRYLASVTDESVMQSTILDQWKKTHSGDKNGIILSAYHRDQADEMPGHPSYTGQNAHDRAQYVSKVYLWKDAFFTFLPREYDGKFYRQTIYRPGTPADIPLSDDRAPEKYGGHFTASTAYMAIVGYERTVKRGRKRTRLPEDEEAMEAAAPGVQIRELISVPVYVAKRQTQDPDAILRYARERLGMGEAEGYRNLCLLREKVLLNQEILYQGTEFYMKSAQEMAPAHQLFLPSACLPMTRLVLSQSADDLESMIEDKKAQEEDLNTLLRILIDKLTATYPIYRRLCRQLREAGDEIFALLPSKKALICRILISVMGTKRESVMPALRELSGTVIRGEPNLSMKRIYGEELVLLNRSVTGIYSSKTII